MAVQARLQGPGTDFEAERSLAFGGSYVLDRLWRGLELDRIHRVDLRAKDGAFQVVTKLTAEQRKLLKALEITPPK